MRMIYKMASNLEIFQRLKGYIGKPLGGKFVEALLSALAEGDSFNQDNILAVKDQLFIATATGDFLDRLLSGIGVTRPVGVGINDPDFRDLAIKQTNSKLVTNILLDVLEVFYGADAVRANLQATRSEDYVLFDGATLIIGVDSNPTPLTVTFKASEFSNIGIATAIEVANVISTASFNAGYTLTALAELNPSDNSYYVRLLSGTKGPRSSVTVLGGSAQNILRFPQMKAATPQGGTIFSIAFVGQHVRFTWNGGPNPNLAFVQVGDYVNIYVPGYPPQNNGSFTVEDVQDGPVGSAYFDIINPNFYPAISTNLPAPITLTFVGGVSGGGTVSRVIDITTAPIGAVRSSNVTTITTIAPHNLSVGQTVTIAGVDNTSFNGNYTIQFVTSNTIIYSQFGNNAISGLGTITVTSNVQANPNGAIRTSGVSTITTTAPHNLLAGQSVTVTSVGDSSFDGFVDILSTPTSNTFTYSQPYSNDITFFAPYKATLQKLSRYASIYQVNPHEVVAFLPATTNIVKRTLIGSAHIHEKPTDKNFIGSYTFNTKSGFPITGTNTNLTADITRGEITTVLFGTDTSKFPDEQGFVVFEYGTSNQEGPVKYLARPSDQSILIDPSYKFKMDHAAGTNMTLVAGSKPYIPSIVGTDYQAYVTSTVNGRAAATTLIQNLSAAGIFLSIIIVYPKGPGLNSIQQVYAGDPGTSQGVF